MDAVGEFLYGLIILCVVVSLIWKFFHALIVECRCPGCRHRFTLKATGRNSPHMESPDEYRMEFKCKRCAHISWETKKSPDFSG